MLCLRQLTQQCLSGPLRNTVKKMSGKAFRVCVEGNIGSGKTRFLRHLAQSDHQGHIDIKEEPVHEWRDVNGHNLLSLMYSDPRQYSFLFQTYVQLSLLRMHTKESQKRLVITERSLLSARYCFVENLFNNELMAHSEYAVLSQWFNFLITNLDLSVDLIVYLRTRPEVAYERLRQRDRAEETNDNNVSLEYLRQLHDLHEQWLFHRTTFQPLPAPVMVMEADEDMDKLLTRYDLLRDELYRLASS